MAYIGETIRQKPEYIVEGGIGIITLPNTQNNSLFFDTDFTDKVFKFVNVNTTLTMTSTNNYYLLGEAEVLGSAVFDIAGTGTLTVI